MPKSTAGIPSEAQATLTALSNTPKQIARIARGCNDLQLHRKPAPDAWSARDILAHLRACAEVWGRSIERTIVGRDATVLSYAKRIGDHELKHLDQLRRTLER